MFKLKVIESEQILLRFRGEADSIIHGFFCFASRKALCSLPNTSSAAIYSPVARACSREANPLAINSFRASRRSILERRELSIKAESVSPSRNTCSAEWRSSGSTRSDGNDALFMNKRVIEIVSRRCKCNAIYNTLRYLANRETTITNTKNARASIQEALQKPMDNQRAKRMNSGGSIAESEKMIALKSVESFA